MISVYQVDWRVDGGGEYVPPDALGDDSHYMDRYGTDIIPANNQKMAEEIVEIARPRAEIIIVKRLANLREQH